jgi:hypothetical protein
MHIQSSHWLQNRAADQSLHTDQTPKSSFASLFEHERQNNQPTEKTGLRQQAQDPVCLGIVTHENPTVSHLLVNHPEFGADCWQIVHSKPNANKAYTQIPSGTHIYLNPKTQEIVWSEQTKAGGVHSVEEQGEPVFSGQASHVSRESPEISEHIRFASAKHDVPEALIRAVIQAESNYKPNALSSAGAQGLMQLMPQTAEELGVTDPFDIKENIDGGTCYLRKMLDLFDGDVRLAVAAYNAGPHAVKSYHGMVPYQETQLYVQKVLASYQALS